MTQGCGFELDNTNNLVLNEKTEETVFKIHQASHAIPKPYH
jgi:hypothetical protein